MQACRISLVAAALFASLGLETASAQDAKSRASLEEKFNAARVLYQGKHFAEAAALLEPFYIAGPSDVGREWYSVMYDLACDEALVGHKERALEVLAASQADGGSISAEHLAADTDLTSLHGDPRFTHLVDEAKSHQRLWSNEPGQDAPYAPDLSQESKVAGLSAFWAEARFNFAFFDRQPELDWNQRYLSYIPLVRATKSTEDYYRVMMRFAAELKDGHTNIWPPDVLTDAFYASPGLRTRLLENSVVVTAVDDPALSAQGWKVGDVLRKINNEDVRSYAEREVAPYQSTSTSQDLISRTYGFALLQGHAGSDLAVTVENAQGRTSLRYLKRLASEQRAKFIHRPKADFVLRSDGIAVLTVNEFEDEEGTKLLLANFTKVLSSKGLIIDIRANGGGNTPLDLLQMLADKPVPGPWQRTRMYRAVDRAWGTLPGWYDLPTEQYPPDATHHVSVPVAVLTSAMTFSAAEDFTAAFNAMHRGITVGQTTGGSTGQPLFFHLPGGGSGRVCTKNDRAGDGAVFEGIGLVPTIEASPTLADVRSGIDVVMNRAAAALLEKQPQRNHHRLLIPNDDLRLTL